VLATGPVRADREVYQRVLQRFEDRLKIDPVNRSRLVSIQFDSNDAGLAARIAIAWRRTTSIKTYRPGGGNAKGCGLAFRSNCWASKRDWRNRKSTFRIMRGATTWSFRNGQGTKPERRERAGPARQEELTKAEAQRYEKEALYRDTRPVTTSPCPGSLKAR